MEAVHKASERGYVRGLDKRKILVDSKHKSLNYLIQGSSSIIAKRWMVLAYKHLIESASQLAFIHDELQYECDPCDVGYMIGCLESTAVQAGEYYKLRCPIAAEAKSGRTWADVH